MSKFSNTQPRTGAFGRQLISASQFKKIVLCLARWAFDKLEGIREPSSDAMEKGTEYHRQLEMYTLYGVYPTHPCAQAGVKYCPAPRIAETEVVVRFDTIELLPHMADRDVCWLGYIDLAYDVEVTVDEAGETHLIPRPVGTTGITVVHDWKFTGKLENALTEEQLLADSAATLYAAEAYLGGAEVVYLRWVWITRAKKPQVKVVWVCMPLERVLANLEDMSATVHEKEIPKLVKLRPKADTLPKNPDACFEFKRLCYYKDLKLCSLRATFKKKETQMSQDFESEMAKNFPGGAPPPSSKKNLPPPSSKPAKMGAPPPSSKAAPPPSSKPSGPPPSSKKPTDIDAKWEQHKKDLQQDESQLGKPESGTYNAPEAPATASPSPEAAYDRQQLGAAAEAKEEEAVADDLDGLSKEQLVWYGSLYGICEKGTKSRPKTLLANIRGWRKANPGKWASYDEACNAAGHNEAAGEGELPPGGSKGQSVKEDLEAESDIQAGGGVTPDEAAEIFEMQKAAAEQAYLAEKARKQTEQTKKPGYMLMVNQAMTKASSQAVAVFQENLVRAAQEEMGVPDFRFVDFGKGAGELSCWLQEFIQKGGLNEAQLVFIDTRTWAGGVMVDVLSEHAAFVFRGTT